MRILGDEVPEDLKGLAQVHVGGGVDCADPDVLWRDGCLWIDEGEFGGLGFDEVNAVESELDRFILDGDGAF